MKHALIPLKGYLLVLCLFWLLGAVALLIWGYQGSFLILNQLHTPFIDPLMPHFTHPAGFAVLVAAPQEPFPGTYHSGDHDGGEPANSRLKELSLSGHVAAYCRVSAKR